MLQMILLLYFIHFLKNDVEFVDDFSDCKEIFLLRIFHSSSVQFCIGI